MSTPKLLEYERKVSPAGLIYGNDGEFSVSDCLDANTNIIGTSAEFENVTIENATFKNIDVDKSDLFLSLDIERIDRVLNNMTPNQLKNFIANCNDLKQKAECILLQIT